MLRSFSACAASWKLVSDALFIDADDLAILHQQSAVDDAVGDVVGA